MTTFRYQPIWLEAVPGDTASRWYTLCEVHLNEAGKLESWSDPQVPPIGNDQDDLIEALNRMCSAALNWKAVNHADLVAGMEFERLAEMEYREV